MTPQPIPPETCDVHGCEKRAAYIAEPGYWLCPDHIRLNPTTAKENDMTETTAALDRMAEWADEWEIGEFDYTVSDFRGLLAEVRALLAPQVQDKPAGGVS